MGKGNGEVIRLLLRDMELALDGVAVMSRLSGSIFERNMAMPLMPGEGTALRTGLQLALTMSLMTGVRGCRPRCGVLGGSVDVVAVPLDLVARTPCSESSSQETD